MLTYLLLIILAAIALILVLASQKPDAFEVKRQITVNASATKVFSFLENFRSWQAWSPWEKLDPGMNRSLSGKEQGVGAVYEWTGNKKVGQGRMEILDVVPAKSVTIDLMFLKPFKAHNKAHFSLASEGKATRVVWSMTGTNNLMFKVMQIFTSMDAMVGKDFEEGLANLKKLAEEGKP